MENKEIQLRKLVYEVARDYGYLATAEFAKTDKFNVTWIRKPTEHDIEMTFTDWLIDAPVEILGEIVEVIFLKMFTDENPEYSSATLEYIEKVKQAHGKQ